MFQTIQGRKVYVVAFTEMPELPIYHRKGGILLQPFGGATLPMGGKTLMDCYAEALDSAIRQGIVSKPGKYAIEIDDQGNWTIYEVQD